MDLRYFAYVSRGKVAQLYEQISELSDTTERLERRRELDGRVKAGGGLKGLLSADFEAGGIKSVVSEVTGTRGDIQKLQAVLEYIQAEEVVLDLNELCAQGPGAKLDGFAYAYRGSFTVLGSLAREPKGHNDGWDSPALTINEKVMLEGPDEIVLSRSSFVEPARRENGYAELGPNKGTLVSDIAMLISTCGSYAVSLACSLKYFSEMGGHWQETTKEFSIGPHSGNYHFFNGSTSAFLEGLLFINGVRSHTVLASPLFLNYAVQPGLIL